MKKIYWMLSMVAAFLLAAGTARAQSVDDKIRSLEQELGQLKEQQIEFRKEATAQGAAMPTFSYRDGAGLNITAADQSWGIRFGYEYALDWMKLEGQDARREGDLGIFMRRNRPQISYIWDRGMYEILAELDMDGDETTTKENIIQRACFRTHFEKLNPWLPQYQVGVDCSGAGSRYRSSEMTFELPTVDRNSGYNTGSYVGMGWSWNDLPAFGLPGNQQFHYNWALHGVGRGDGLKDQSNKFDHMMSWTINPFSQEKNKWLSGIGFSMFAWFGNIDDRNATNSSTTQQLRSQEGSTRVTFWTTPTQGSGLQTFLQPSAQYKVGPYQLNFVAGFHRFNEDSRNRQGSAVGTIAAPNPGDAGRVGRSQATYWKFMNDLMVWSPKGFLTGAPGVPGTVGFGYSFEKSWASCGFPGCDTANGGQVNRTTEVVNEWGMRYWWRSNMSLHLVVKNYDVSNTPAAAQAQVGCSANNNVGNSGKHCNFTDIVLRMYVVY